MGWAKQYGYDDAIGNCFILRIGEEVVVEEVHVGVEGFDEVGFFAATPFFDLLFAFDGLIHIVVVFVVEQVVAVVCFAEAGVFSGDVFLETLANIGCYSGI